MNMKNRNRNAVALLALAIPSWIFTPSLSAQEGGTANARPITVHVIGFDVDAATAQQLTSMAQAGGGRYFPASNEAELSSALGEAAGVPIGGTNSAEQGENNSRGTANSVAPSSQLSGTIDPRGDRDYYITEVSQQGILRVHLSGVPGLELSARVYNAEMVGITGWFRPLRAGAEVEGVANIPGAGRYYVYVEDAGSDGASTEAYSLSLEFLAGDAFEPNNSFGTATEIEPTTQVFSSVLPMGDADYFTFEVERQGALHVNCTGIAPEVDLEFRLYNAEHVGISGYVRPLRPGADTTEVLDLPTAGRYYLYLRDYQGNAISPANHSIELLYEPGDNQEPNNSFGKATTIDPDGDLAANILPKGDADTYRFLVDHPGAIRVKLGNVPPNLELEFRVYDAEWTGRTGWLAPLRAGAENEAIVDLVKAGWYYLFVRERGGDERAAENYSLELSYMRADTHEPNPTFGTAVGIATGQAVSGSILPKGDKDWYHFDVAAPGQIEVRVTDVPAELDVHVRVYNAEGVGVSGWIAPLRAGAETVGAVDLKAAGTYYVVVVDGKHDARSELNYRLTVGPGTGAVK